MALAARIKKDRTGIPAKRSSMKVERGRFYASCAVGLLFRGLAGLPFLAFGIAVGWATVAVGMKKGDWQLILPLSLLALLFTAVGVFLTFIRIDMEIDLASGRIRRGVGLIIPLWWREIGNLADYNRVVARITSTTAHLALHVQQYSNHIVELHGPAKKTPPIPLAIADDLQALTVKAQKISEMIGLPVKPQ